MEYRVPNHSHPPAYHVIGPEAELAALGQLFQFHDDGAQVRDSRLRPDPGVLDIESPGILGR